MKKIYLILIVTLFNLNLFSQLRDLGAPKILVGMGEDYVLKYFNELNSLSSNSAYRIEKEYNNEGNLTYKVEFAMAEEKYYNCLSMDASFRKGKDGLICESQSLFFTNVSADANVNQLNKVFTKYKSNEWRFDYNSKIYIEAQFFKVESSYGILYIFRPKD